MATFKRVNLNPYGRSTEDCATRALVAGTLFGYRTIAETLGAEIFRSLGASSVSVDSLREFADITEIMSNYDFEVKEDWSISKRDFENFQRYNGMNVIFWVDHLDNTEVGSSRMIFLCKSKDNENVPNGEDRDFHVVFADIMKNEYYDNVDSGGLIVFDMYRIDESKLCRRNDPRYFKTEENDIRSENDEYMKSLRKFKESYDKLFEN